MDVNSHLTDDHQDKDEGGHSRADVEHDSDVVCQLSHIVHIRHEDGWDQEPNGNAQLEVRGTRLKNDSAPLADDYTHTQSVHIIKGGRHHYKSGERLK